MKIKNIHFVYKLYTIENFIEIGQFSYNNNSYYFPPFDPEQKIRKIFRINPSNFSKKKKKKKKDSFVSILKKSHTVLIGRLL